jgi:hypothetical protein
MSTTFSETIEWFRVEQALPDSDTTVMIQCPTESEPVWIGWYDAEEREWYSADAMPVAVTAWADMPRGIT